MVTLCFIPMNLKVATCVEIQILFHQHSAVVYIYQKSFGQYKSIHHQNIVTKTPPKRLNGLS